LLALGEVGSKDFPGTLDMTESRQRERMLAAERRCPIGRLRPIGPAEGNLRNYPWPLALDVERAFHPCNISAKDK
jgi:hypothetical protein